MALTPSRDLQLPCDLHGFPSRHSGALALRVLKGVVKTLPGSRVTGDRRIKITSFRFPLPNHRVSAPGQGLPLAAPCRALSDFLVDQEEPMARGAKALLCQMGEARPWLSLEQTGTLHMFP